jgi:3-hydroxyacyl-CoA dehydrogenase
MRNLRSVGILGAGLMGRQIARAHAASGRQVRLFDANPTQVDQALAWIREQAAECEAADLDTVCDRIRPVQILEEAAACDLIIEAVVEEARVKQDVLEAAERAAGAQTLIASNTSSIPLIELARKLNRRERFCGLHFCHPVSERPLVEVVASVGTAETTIKTIVEHVRSLGLSPLLAPDCPGFLLNRLLNPYLNLAVDLLERGGGDLHSIETAAIELGMPVGPFTFLDRIGIDTAIRVGGNLYLTQASRVQAVRLPVALFKAGHLGQKSGAGFFQYDAGQPPPINPFLNEWLRRGGSVDPPPCLSVAELRNRLWSALVSEVALAVGEGVALGDAWQALALGVGWRAPVVHRAHGATTPHSLIRKAAQSSTP